MTEDNAQAVIETFKTGVSQAEIQAGFTTPDESSRLYHYTTVDGLNGIVDQKSIRGTHHAYLNDSSEIRYAKELLDEVIAEKTDSLASLPKAVLLAVRNTPGGLLAPAESFLACFCEADDLLSQWRGYGSSGGYTLGFSWHGPNNHLVGKDYVLKKVIYDKDRQRELLSTFADHFIESITALTLNEDINHETISQSLFTDLDLGSWPPTQALTMPRPLQDLCWAAIYKYAQIAPYLKNSAFESEHEWRLVHTRSATPSPRFADLNFRANRGLLIPYIDLDMFLKGGTMRSGANDQPNFSIKSITIGPNVNFQAAKRAIELLLAKNFPSIPIDIRNSKVPVIL